MDQGEVHACSSHHCGAYGLPLHPCLVSATKNCVIGNYNHLISEGNKLAYIKENKSQQQPVRHNALNTSNTRHKALVNN